MMDEEMINTIIAGIIALAAFFFARHKKAAVRDALDVSRLPQSIRNYAGYIKNAAYEYNVPASIIAAVVWQESRGDQSAVGSVGEIGLMQLRPIAVQDLQLAGLWPDGNVRVNAADNIRQGAAFLKLQRRRAGNWPEALRAYNAGYSRTQKDKLMASGYRDSVLSKAREFGYSG